MEAASPKQVLSLADATAIIVGLIVGAGIFKTPSLVAGFSAGETMTIVWWIAGGIISIIGAMCYAELATAFPSAGSEYHFLGRAFGRQVAFLYGWARLTVIVAGSIALFAFLFGDYFSRVVNLGEHSSALWAGIAVTVLTAVNYVGIRAGKTTQDVFTVLEVAGLVLVVVAVGLLLAPEVPSLRPAAAAGDKPWHAGAG
jgi:amino acid transporter